MQLQTLLLASMALATAAADRVLTTTSCPWTGACDSRGEWINDHGEHFWFDANEGCRNPGVTNIHNVCFDWNNKRAHFDANGQNKRCLKKEETDVDVGPCADTSRQCSRQWWNEVGCSW